MPIVVVDPTFDRYKAAYKANWNQLQPRPEVIPLADRTAKAIFNNKVTYQECERIDGVPWWFHGLVHFREANMDFSDYLGNGQPLNRVTTLVPKHRGPWLGPGAFELGALDAMQIQGYVGATDWSIERTCYRDERFNGLGYHAQNVNSPYLYGGSTLYGPPQARGGKYTSDNHFDPNYTDTQLGTLVVLKRLMLVDLTIMFQPEGAVQQPDDIMAHGISWIQQVLNSIDAAKLTVDGAFGRNTMKAIAAFQKKNNLLDTGLPDAATIAVMQAAVQPVATVDALSKYAGFPSLSQSDIAFINSTTVLKPRRPR